MKRLTGLPLCLLLLALLLPTPLWAAAGKVVIAAGDVFAVNAQNQRRLLQRRDNVFEGDTLITGANSNLQLRLEDNAILALRANSQLRISNYQGEQVVMELLTGGFRTIGGRFSTADQASYRVRTPTASVRIHSAHYEVVFATPTMTVGVYEGSLTATNALGTIDLGLDNDFLYAQLESGQLPLGLLDPPTNLLALSTPRAGTTANQTGSDSGDDDLSDLTNGNSQAPSNDPDNTTLPVPDADAISDGDFDFSAIEDDIEKQDKAQCANNRLAFSRPNNAGVFITGNNTG
ncbi:FecR family protein [Saccharospirillum sp. HFRX-1]|uniref:FecR family protein n=1 Tax=unclassified Saccharospirillum TaxID=2633430 RepID=UPI003711F9D7